MDAIAKAEAQIQEVEAQIQGVEDSINQAAQKFLSYLEAGKESLADYWRKKEEHLRKTEQQLRKEEQQLRKKEEQLHKEKEQHQPDVIRETKRQYACIDAAMQNFMKKLEKKLKVTGSRTDYEAVAKDVMCREDWVGSLTIWRAFDQDVSHLLRCLLRTVIGFSPNDGELLEAADERLERELKDAGLSFKDQTLARNEASIRNTEIDEKRLPWNKYTVDALEGETVVQLTHGSVYRWLQAAGIKYRAEDTHRRGVASSAVRPNYCFYDLFSAGRDFSVMVFVAEFKDKVQENDEVDALGKLISRMRDILDAQDRRKFVYGFLADGEKLMVVQLSRSSEEIEHYVRTDWLPLSFSLKSPGLVMLLRLLYSDRTLHGFVPPPLISDFRIADGKVVKDPMPLVEKGDTESPTRRGTIVYKAEVDGQEVVVKIGPDLQDEISVMTSLADIPGVVPVLAYGLEKSFLEGRDYLISPRFHTLDMNLADDGSFLLDRLKQVAWTINQLAGSGVFHGDISYGNIVYKEEQAYLIDFGSALRKNERNSLGTLIFMAYGALDGQEHCLSMELESLMYVLVCVAVGGHVHWRRCKVVQDSASRKAVCFMLNSSFDKHVISRCSNDLFRGVITRMRALFWQPQYSTHVTYEEFVQCFER